MNLPILFIFGTCLIMNSQQICESTFEIPHFFGMQIKGNYFKAQQICHLMGKQVVTPFNAEKDVAVIKFMKENGINEIWTSGSDLGDEGSFNWLLSGRLVNYSNWDVGQPDNAGNIEDCIQIWYRNGQYKWNDLPCTATLTIVCEDKPEDCINVRGNFLSDPSPA